MKIRVKFAKSGAMVYIGHLDIMRYFQKCIRKSGIDIAYSEGYSPHQIMSFAQPLGVGMISQGEYMDIEVNSSPSAEDLRDRLNAVMVPGMEIVNVVKLPDGVKNAMASVAAARYTTYLKNGEPYPDSIVNLIKDYKKLDSLMITKETKKNTLEVDLLPHIYDMDIDSNGLQTLVDASSGGNIKSTQILSAFYDMAGLPYEVTDHQVVRADTFTNVGSEDKPVFVPLDAVGEDY